MNINQKSNGTMKQFFKKAVFKYLNEKKQINDIPETTYEKYRKSGLTPSQGLIIKEKITYALEVDKIYRTNNLSLDDLANHITYNRYKISEVVNTHFSKNFYNLLNHYRIKEAKELLIADTHLSVKAVMYEVGFNSKNSFYSAFKKDTGLSPNDFRSLSQYDYSKLNIA